MPETTAPERLKTNIGTNINVFHDEVEYIRLDLHDAALAALARSVEWVDRGDHHACPGCGNWKEGNGQHHPDCSIGNALQGGTAALDAAVEQARREDDEDFIKLVRQLAAMNATVENLVEAIIEDVGYGAHRVDRAYAREVAAKELRENNGI